MPPQRDPTARPPAPRSFGPATGSLWRSAAYLSAYAVSRVVPESCGIFIADTASGLAHALKFRERLGVRRNLAAALGAAAGSDEVRTAARRMYRNFGRSCAALLYRTRSHRPGDPFLPDLEIEGLGLFERALREGRGVLLVSPHAGSWEMGAMALASRGYPVAALVHPPAIGANGLYERCRRRTSLETFSAATAAFRCRSLLRSGGALGIVADRRFGSGTLRAQLFGRDTDLPQGPVRIAMWTGAPIVGAALRLNAGSAGGPKLKFYGRIDPASEVHAADLPALQQRLADLIGGIIAEAPEEWYCFEDLWGEPSGVQAR